MKIKTSMPKSGKLITAYKAGGEVFRKYCLTYGQIVHDVRTEDAQEQPERYYEIHIDGLLAHIGMRTGEVTEYGYKLIKGVA